MALAHLDSVEIQMSPARTMVITDPVIIYDAYSDELIFKRDGNRRQSFSCPVNDYVSLLYDDDADQTIGIQIDDFATYAVHEFPALEAIAKIVGIEPRQRDDTALFRDGRIVQRAQEFTPEDEAEFKKVIRRIIDYTGGFDPDITVERKAV
jgi:hypothetical protein